MTGGCLDINDVVAAIGADQGRTGMGGFNCDGVNVLAKADIDDLKVTAGFVNEGPTMKRWLPRAKGRATSLFKRSSHITVQVGDTGENN